MDESALARPAEEPVTTTPRAAGPPEPPAQLAFGFEVDTAQRPVAVDLDHSLEAPGLKSRRRQPHVAASVSRRAQSTPTCQDRVADDASAPTGQPSSGAVEGGRVPAVRLVSAFGVNFGLPPGSNQVILNAAGKVVEGHLQVFAADGGEVLTSSQDYELASEAEAASREFRRARAVSLQAQPLLGHTASLGVKAGKSKTAIARDAHVSRSLIARCAPVTALMDKHPDLALSKSHFEAVLPLEEPEQERLLQEAADEKLPVRELEQLIATAHPERRRQRRGDETLAELVELAGVAERFGAEWQRDRRGCVADVRRLLRLTGDRAPHLLGVPRGTDETA